MLKMNSGAFGPLLMYDDASAADGLKVAQVRSHGVAHHVVVDDRAGHGIPDLEPQPIHVVSTECLAVCCGEQEGVAAPPVDLTCAFVLRERALHDQPFVGLALELEVADLEV